MTRIASHRISVIKVCITLLSLALMAGCASIIPSRPVDSGRRVRDDKVFVIGRIDFDVEIEQDLERGALPGEGEAELFFITGDSGNIETAYVPLNEHFVIQLDRENLGFLSINVLTFYRETRTHAGNTTFINIQSNSIGWEYALPEVQIGSEDQFIYIGDITHRVTFRNPYGIQDVRVDITDNFSEISSEFDGYVVNTDGQPLTPVNRAQAVTTVRTSDIYPTYGFTSNSNAPAQIHAEEEIALRTDGSFRLDTSGSIAVISADTTNLALSMVDRIEDRLAAETSLRVLSEQAVTTALPLYPANFVNEGNLFGEEDTRLLVEIGRALGVDYVYALRRSSASMTDRDRFLGFSTNFELSAEGTLIDVATEQRVGQTRYYTEQGQWIVGGFLVGSSGLYERMIGLENEASQEIADAVAERFIELAGR